MKVQGFTVGALSLLALGLLGGCSSTDDISASDMEQAAVSAVKSSSGQDTAVNCEGASMPAEAGASTTCRLTVEGEASDRSAVIEVADVTEQGYSLDVKVIPALDDSSALPSPSVRPSATGANTPDSAEKSSVAEVAAEALEPHLGQRPQVDCGEGSVLLAEGTELECSVVSASDHALGDARVVLNQVEGSGYSVDVTLEQTETEQAN